MTQAVIEFLQKYLTDPLVTVAFAADYIVARRVSDYSEIERVECPGAGAIAMQLLMEKIDLKGMMP